jgi:hypothetical protein
MRSTLSLALCLGSLLAACGPSSRNPGGDDTSGIDSGPGGNTEGCSDAAKLVYVVDENNQLSTWDGMTKTFHDLGTLDCPAQALATPFSMGVDRNATAWVLYSSGELFQVNTTTLACTKSNWATQLGLEQFGMGFSSDAAGGTADHLFVAGGTASAVMAPTSKLATLDTGTLSAASVGTVTGWPELTGTGNAELWGFFPDAAGARVEKIDKANGGALKTYQLPSLAGTPAAWAFAFWGGDFWVFLMRDTDLSTTVYQIDAATGQVKGMTPTGTRTIVGAGVSTCAPTVIL